MILARLIRLGYSVSLPFGNNQRYDMVVEEDGRLLKVQCKTGRLKGGTVNFPTSSINGFTGKRRGYKGHADLFMVYCPINGEVYRVPVSVAGAVECNLRLTPAKNGQIKGVKLAEDFKLACSSKSEHRTHNP